MPIRITDIPALQPTRLNQAEMDPRVAAAPGRALEGLAAEIASVSKPFADIANRLQDVANSTTQTKLQTQMEARQAELQRELAADPGNPKILQRVETFSKETAAMLETAGVPPEVQDRLRPVQQQMAHRMKIHAAERAGNHVIAEGRQAFQQRMALAVDDPEDDGAIDREADAAKAANLAPADEVEAARAQAKVLRSDKKVSAEIERDAGGWIARNQNPNREAPDFDEAKHAHRMREARRVHSGKTLGIYYAAARDIEAGTLTRPQRIDELTHGLAPAAAVKLKEMLAGKVKPGADGQRPRHEVQSQFAGDVGARLLAYRADGSDYDGNLIEIADRIRQMDDGPLKTVYEENLLDTVSGTKRHPKTNAEFYRLAIDQEWENYGFGRERAPVHRIDVAKLISRGLLRERGKLKETGLSEADIDYITGARAGKSIAHGGQQPAVDDRTSMVRFAERYAALKEKKALADPFLQAVFTTLGERKTVMDYTMPEDAEEAERKNGAARARYGAALTGYTGWVQRNPDADEQKLRAAAEQAATAKARHDASSAILRR